MNSIKDKVTSVETFVRLPWVAWAAPKAIRSDMSGPTLLGVVGAELTAGTAKPNVLKPTGTVTLPDGGAGPHGRRRRQAARRRPLPALEVGGRDLLAVPARVAEGAGVGLGALEVQVQVVLPGEADAAVDLHG